MEYFVTEKRTWYITPQHKPNMSVFYNGGHNLDPNLFDLSTLTYTFELDEDDDVASTTVEFTCKYKEPISVLNHKYEEQLVEHKQLVEEYDNVDLVEHTLKLKQYELELEEYEAYQQRMKSAEDALRQKLVSAGLNEQEIEVTLKATGKNKAVKA